MSHRKNISPIIKLLLLIVYMLYYMPESVLSYSILFRAEMNCSQLCSCHHNALVNTMKQYNVKHFTIMGEKYRQQNTAFDVKSEYMVFLGTFAPILHRIAEINCSIKDGQTHSIMSLLNGVEDYMDTALEVVCAKSETLIWDVPTWHITFNIFVSKNCIIVPKEELKVIIIPMNMWILDIDDGGQNVMSLIDVRYSMNTLTIAVTGSMLANTPEQWKGKYMISASFISLKDNALEEFTCPFKFTKRVDTLNLENNKLPNFPECILYSNNFMLTYLSLANNYITDLTLLYEVPESKNEPDISIINLSFNHIKSVESIRDMGKLIVLDLSHNVIKDITEDAFENLAFLKVLYLSDNKIYTLGAHQFTSNLMLNILDLSSNLLTTLFPEQLPITLQTISLDVRQNKLLYPPFRDCAKNKLENFDIKIYSAGNPFYCDCYMIEFEKCQQWVQDNVANYSSKQDNIFKDLQSLICANPPENRNVFLSELSFHSKCIIVEDCPVACACFLLNVKKLIINCSGRRLLEMPDTLPSYPDAITALYLDHNPLQMLSHRPYLRTLSELYMDNCLLTSVTPAAMFSLQDIRILTLHNNLLQKLPSSTRNITLNHARNVTLHNNRWACTCDSLWLPRWITKHKSALWKSGTIVCQYLRKPVEELSEMDLNCNSSSYIDTFLAISLIFTSLVSTLVIGICYRTELSLLLYSKLGLRLDRGFTYSCFFSPNDAFISYSQDTQNWVNQILVPRLENGKKKYKLCLHFRDFPKGDSAQDDLPWSIRRSQCAILVLSKEVTKKEWRIMEVRAAFQRLLLVANKLTIIVVDDMNIDKLSPDLYSYMNTHTYLSFEDPCFWDKLEQLLPPREDCTSRETSVSSAKRGAGDSLGRSTSDRFEDTAPTDVSEISCKPTEVTDADT